MMSPIAVASARAVLKSGGRLKGRRRTTYKRPAIAELFSKCGSIEALGRMRRSLAYGAFKGTVNPTEKTEQKWERAFWLRVLELILAADGVKSCPAAIYNHQLRWLKPPHIAAAIEAAVEAQCKILPSQVERWRAQGIIVVT